MIYLQRLSQRWEVLFKGEWQRAMAHRGMQLQTATGGDGSDRSWEAHERLQLAAERLDVARQPCASPLSSTRSLRRGVKRLWTGLDLSGADLRNADLRGVSLEGWELFGARLHGAKIDRHTGLEFANWWQADFFASEEREEIDRQLLEALCAHPDAPTPQEMQDAHPSVERFRKKMAAGGGEPGDK